MFASIKRKLFIHYLSDSVLELKAKSNGYINVLIYHNNPAIGLVVLHPEQERGQSDAEDGLIRDSTPMYL